MAQHTAQKPASDVLRDTLRQLPNHWIQRRWHDINGNRCLAGWLGHTSNPTGDAYWDDAFAQALDCVAQAIGVDPGDITSWNDTAGRTEADVLDALRKAIRIAMAAEAAAAA